MTVLSTQSLPLSAPSVKERTGDVRRIWEHRQLAIASLATACIALHLVLRFTLKAGPSAQLWPLWIALAAGGTPLVLELAVRLVRGQFGSDLLAGISIVTALLLQEYLAGALVVLMLSGGQALESFAVDSASSALRAMARRLPSAAHRKVDSRLVEVPLAQITPGDTLVVFPHEICPADGTVVEGHGGMDESFLTGEPFNISKAPGAGVLCGAVNGESVLVVRAEKPAVDSRYERIIRVMRTSEQATPRSRRLGDRLGALYTPLALAIGLVAWAAAGHPSRFLAVMVIATPCPLLIAIPVAIIGAISMSARRGIVIKKAAALEQADGCRTVIFDKTGTLTYGEPELVEQLNVGLLSANDVLALVASLERYSKHPLAKAILKAADKLHVPLHEPTEVSEQPGRGLRGTVNGRVVRVTGRGKLRVSKPDLAALLPAAAGGLECIVLIDGKYAARWHQRCPSPRRSDRRRRSRAKQRRGRRCRQRRHHGQLPSARRRIPPHQPSHAVNPPAKRDRRNGLERRWNASGRSGPFVSSRRRDFAGSDRRPGRIERPAGSAPTQDAFRLRFELNEGAASQGSGAPRTGALDSIWRGIESSLDLSEANHFRGPVAFPNHDATACAVNASKASNTRGR